MNKKGLMLVAGLSCFVLAGCVTKTTPIETIDTGALFSGEEVLTSGEILSGQNNNTREELTGEEGSLTITGQKVTSGTSLSDDIKAAIQQRAKKPIDTGKLTEDDIDLIDKVIQKVENLGK